MTERERAALGASAIVAVAGVLVALSSSARRESAPAPDLPIAAAPQQPTHVEAGTPPGASGEIPACSVGVVMGGMDSDIYGTPTPTTAFRAVNCAPGTRFFCNALDRNYMLCFPSQAECQEHRADAVAAGLVADECEPAQTEVWCADLPARRCFSTSLRCRQFIEDNRESLRFVTPPACVPRRTI